MAKVYILMPVHNRLSKTARMVKSLARQSHQNFQLILIDDGSTDGTSDMVAKELPGTVFIKGRGRWWWAGSLQKGYKWLKDNRIGISDDDIVLIINDDDIIDDDFLKIGVEKLTPLNKCLVIANAYNADQGTNQSGILCSWKMLSFQPVSIEKQANCCSTEGLFIKFCDFIAIRGFRPLLIPHYLSDYEFTYRAFKKGYRIVSYRELSLRSETSLRNDPAVLKRLSLFERVFSARSPNRIMSWVWFVILHAPPSYYIGFIPRRIHMIRFK